MKLCTKLLLRMRMALPVAALMFSASLSAAQISDNETYPIELEVDWLTMPDGVRVSVTYFRPVSEDGSEKFPVLLELLPYRKDDQFYLRDDPIHSYFARRGFVVAKVDIRGTGGSEGHVPPREYSNQELDDAVEIIRRLSDAPWSNGNVGMFGISWGGFNAIQVAMRKPRGLEAILALHASDDLYHDDVHYIDGILHVDEYELQIDMDNGLPRTPDFPLDEAYFENRFNAFPWFFTYLKQQVDGDFWRKHSLRWDYGAIEIPVYLIGGLLDGYRDTVPRMLENMSVPMRGVLGPWNHSFPDDGVPGPNYEWRHDAVRWWRHWLEGMDTGIVEEPRFTVFVRDGHPPDASLEETPGRWRREDWPIRRTDWKTLYPGGDHTLLQNPGERAVHGLKYVPSYGIEAGIWWGEPTGDMRPVDAGSLVYDGPVLEEKIEIVGFPRAHLRASADAPLAHWVVRLEDVHPNGEVSLVAGAALNGAQRSSRTKPETMVPGRLYDLTIDMHFTTWTFEPGHRIRLAVSNSLFPMLWPTPHRMTTEIHVGGEATRLIVPRIPMEDRPVPNFRAPEPREERDDARYLESSPRKVTVERDLTTSTTTYAIGWDGRFEIKNRLHYAYENHKYRVSDVNPAEASYEGEAGHRITIGERVVELKTFLSLRSDKLNFFARFTRRLFESGRLVRERTWEETIPRSFQ